MKSTLIGIYSPKTSGATLIGYNMALTHQMLDSSKQVAYIQLTAYPNIHFYSGLKYCHHIGELVEFKGTKEWGVSIIKKISQSRGCDIYESPYLSDWNEINENDVKLILRELEKLYEVIYVDFNNSIPEKIFKYIYNSVDIINLVSTPDPLSIDATHKLLEYRKHKNSYLILNQCPKGKINELRHFLNKYDINILAFLSTDIKSVWSNVYEGVPLAYQKNSKIKNEIIDGVKILIKEL